MYKNYLLALLSGLLLALAWPTYGFSLFVFIGFVPLLLALNANRKSGRKRVNLVNFFTTYIALLVWNTITTWWIWNSTPAGALFALFVNSLLMTLVFQLYHVVSRRKPQRFALIFLLTLWIAFEKFHLNWDFSWPWLNLGNVFSENPSWIQWYEYTGVFGGSLWIWIVNIGVFVAIEKFQRHNDLKILAKQVLIPISIIVIGIAFSKIQYHSYVEKGEELSVIVIQPNVDPYTEKYHQPLDQIANNIIELSNLEIDDSVSFVLAPETVLSKHSTLKRFKVSKAYKTLSDYTQQYPNTSLLVGSSLIKIFKSKTIPTPTANKFSNTTNSWYESYNAALYITTNKKPEVYHKSKLVVGVENFPYRSALAPLLGNIMIEHGSSTSVLTTQKEAEVFQHPKSGVNAAPIICYESIYGEHVSKFSQKGAGFLAIITNDSWWGRTQGHKQLLSYARIRAVENRKAVARSANSGISAFINQRGDVVKTLAYETKGALKETMKANKTLTFYVKHGDYIARIASFVAVLFLLIALVVKRKKVEG